MTPEGFPRELALRVPSGGFGGFRAGGRGEERTQAGLPPCSSGKSFDAFMLWYGSCGEPRRSACIRR